MVHRKVAATTLPSKATCTLGRPRSAVVSATLRGTALTFRRSTPRCSSVSEAASASTSAAAVSPVTSSAGCRSASAAASASSEGSGAAPASSPMARSSAAASSGVISAVSSGEAGRSPAVSIARAPSAAETRPSPAISSSSADAVSWEGCASPPRGLALVEERDALCRHGSRRRCAGADAGLFACRALELLLELRHGAEQFLALRFGARQLPGQTFDLGVAVLDRLPERVVLAALLARGVGAPYRLVVAPRGLLRLPAHGRGGAAAHLETLALPVGIGLRAERTEDDLVAPVIGHALCPFAREQRATTVAAHGLGLLVLASSKKTSQHHLSRIRRAREDRRGR